MRWDRAMTISSGICIVSVLGLCLAIIGGYKQSQRPGQPVPGQDAVQFVHQEQLFLAEKDKEIHGLEMQLQHEREVSRDVGLMNLDPGPWQQDWTATWYAEGGINGDGVTASGTRVHEMWTAAADTNILPMGTVIEVRFPDNSTGIYQVLDRGGAIKGRHIDIYDPSKPKCFVNGRKKVAIRILMLG